jgi:hypothetical protein
MLTLVDMKFFSDHLVKLKLSGIDITLFAATHIICRCYGNSCGCYFENLHVPLPLTQKEVEDSTLLVALC